MGRRRAADGARGKRKGEWEGLPLVAWGRHPPSGRGARKRTDTDKADRWRSGEGGGVEEEVEDGEVEDAVFVEPAGASVLPDEDLSEAVAGEGEGLEFGEALFFGGEGVGGLDVETFAGPVYDEVDFAGDAGARPGGRSFPGEDDSDIDAPAAGDEFVVDDVFHDVGFFLVAEKGSGVAETDIFAVVFLGVVEIGVPLDVVAFGLGEEIGVFEVGDVGGDGVVGEFRAVGGKGAGQVVGIGEGARGRAEKIDNLPHGGGFGDGMSLDDILEIDLGEEGAEVSFA